jgi:hypothetical protein
VPSTPKLSPTDELWDDERTAAFLGVSRVTFAGSGGRSCSRPSRSALPPAPRAQPCWTFVAAQLG